MKAVSRSNRGEKPQSRRATPSSTSAGQESTMPCRFSSTWNRMSASGNASRTMSSHLLGGRIERADVVGGARQSLTRRRGQRPQRLDAVRHGHERDARVGAHEAGVRLPFRGRMDHLRRIVGGPARRQRHRRDQSREAQAAEVDAAGGTLRGELLVVARVVASRAVRNTACCSRTSWSAGCRGPRRRRRRGRASRDPAARRRQSRTDRRRSPAGRATRPACCANSRSCSVPSTLTWCASLGENSPRVESSAARWKT